MVEVICIITILLGMVVWYFVVKQINTLFDVFIHHTFLMASIMGIVINVNLYPSIFPALISFLYLCIYFYCFYIIPFIKEIDNE